MKELKDRILGVAIENEDGDIFDLTLSDKKLKILLNDNEIVLEKDFYLVLGSLLEIYKDEFRTLDFSELYGYQKIYIPR